MKYLQLLRQIHRRLTTSQAPQIAGLKLTRVPEADKHFAMLPKALLKIKNDVQDLREVLDRKYYKNPAHLFNLLNLVIATFDRLPIPKDKKNSDHEFLIKLCLAVDLTRLNKKQLASLKIYARNKPLETFFNNDDDRFLAARIIEAFWPLDEDDRVRPSTVENFNKLDAISQFEKLSLIIIHSEKIHSLYGLSGEGYYEKILATVSLAAFSKQQKIHLAALMKVYSPKHIKLLAFTLDEITESEKIATPLRASITGINVDDVMKELKELLFKEKYEQAHYLIYRLLTANAYQFGPSSSIFNKSPEQMALVAKIKNALAQLRVKSDVDKVSVAQALLVDVETALIQQENTRIKEGLTSHFKPKTNENLKLFFRRTPWKISEHTSSLKQKEKITISHGGGYFHILEFLAGVSPGYTSEISMTGVWFTPGGSKPIDERYAKRTTEQSMDIPARFTATIDPECLEKTNRSDEALLTQEFFSELQDIQVSLNDSPVLEIKNNILNIEPSALRQRVRDDMDIALQLNPYNEQQALSKAFAKIDQVGKNYFWATEKRNKLVQAEIIYIKRYMKQKNIDIFAAWKNQDQRFVDFMFDYEDAASQLNKRDKDGNTILMLIAAQDTVTALDKYIIDEFKKVKNSNTVISNNKGETIAHLAAKNANHQYFFSKADYESVAHNKIGKTPLMVAVESGNLSYIVNVVNSDSGISSYDNEYRLKAVNLLLENFDHLPELDKHKFERELSRVRHSGKVNSLFQATPKTKAILATLQYVDQRLKDPREYKARNVISLFFHKHFAFSQNEKVKAANALLMTLLGDDVAEKTLNAHMRPLKQGQLSKVFELSKPYCSPDTKNVSRLRQL